jgi:hypothetical protein
MKGVSRAKGWIEKAVDTIILDLNIKEAFDEVWHNDSGLQDELRESWVDIIAGFYASKGNVEIESFTDPLVDENENVDGC